MAEKITIEIFRKKLPDELTKSLSEPDSRSDIGSGAALTAASAAAYLTRAAALTAAEKGSAERLEFIQRNGEILRSYMIRLIDEDVKCRGPLRRAQKEGDEYKIEASMQTAAAIANEIINMMSQLLELSEELSAMAAPEAKRFAAASADLAMGAIRACMRYVLALSRKSEDETYRYVVRRENEITLQDCEEKAARILGRCDY